MILTTTNGTVLERELNFKEKPGDPPLIVVVIFWPMYPKGP